MVLAKWEATSRTNIVCVDSYENREMRGRYCNLQNEVESFSSLADFLVKLESRQDESRQIQAPSSAAPPGNNEVPALRKGLLATFELQILFTQHTSWQGILKWREKNMEHSFRSVLELILLIDAALKHIEE